MAETMQYRGVNLGGWLVLEKWMTPSLFTALKAGDEYSFCNELGTKNAREILQLHRDHFITERDFKWMAEHGLNAVRLPVGYWIFGREKPFIGGIEYVDQAMMWAEQYNLKVFIDLHGAPGSQNGEQHSGRSGKRQWHVGDNIKRTTTVLERLAERYAGMPSFGGIELLNEPSWRLGKKRLSAFYEQAYQRVRKHCGPEVAVLISDAFRPKRWKNTLAGPAYTNVYIDVHHYQLFGYRDKHRPALRQLVTALRFRRLIAKLQRHHPVIIGEWSVALPPKSLEHVRDKNDIHRAYGSNQLLAMSDAAGWFYWNYKTEWDGPWSLRSAVKHGWLPKQFD